MTLEEISQLGRKVPVLGRHQNGFPVRGIQIVIPLVNSGTEVIVCDLETEADMLLNHFGAVQGPFPIVTADAREGVGSRIPVDREGGIIPISDIEIIEVVLNRRTVLFRFHG